MSPTPFGEHLKREREMRGVTLEEIAAATRISTRFLEAIENEQWDQLPGGVFNRGFIRSIARFLGLDEDSLVAEYALERQSIGGPPPAETSVRTGRNWRWGALAGGVAAVLIAGAVVAYPHVRPRIHFHWGHRVAPAGDAASRAAVPSPAGSTAPASAPAQPLNSRPSPASDVPAASPAPASAPAMSLKVEAGKAAEVRIVADGRTVFAGRVHPNDVKQYEAKEKFEITTSESSALLLELNGQTVPPIGTPGRPGSLVLTRNDLDSSGRSSH